MKINVLDKTTAAIILFESIINAQGLKGVTNPEVDVIVTINGIEVDVVSTINKLWESESLRVEKLAAKRAFEIITEAGLDEMRKIEEDLRNIKYDIRKKIEKVTDYRFEDEY